MSNATIRARYDGPSGTGVDIPVELATGEVRSVHVPQGGLLPEEIGDTPVSAEFRDRLLDQDGWSRYRQPATRAKADDEKGGGSR